MIRYVFPLGGIAVVALAVSAMAAQVAAKDLASLAGPASQFLALSTSRTASTVETGAQTPLTPAQPDNSLADGAFRVASVAIKFYCRYVGFDSSNRIHYVTGPDSGYPWVSCPVAERKCKASGLRNCRKYGLFRKN